MLQFVTMRGTKTLRYASNVNYEGSFEGYLKFCDAESGVLAIMLYRLSSLVLFIIAMVNACKCCVACCGGKQKNLINVIFSAIGSIVALVMWIIYLGLALLTQYKTNYEEVTKVTGGTTKHWKDLLPFSLKRL